MTQYLRYYGVIPGLIVCPLSYFGNDATERSDVRDAGYLDTFAGDPRIDVG